ncbi:hypothetical protein [Achromobacter aloeverae]|uniref:Uncharacterized protein n=1 Tax=Achromobacter aloeverae TaxID=1750518 RepID=A0A4Q1HLH7_9BURK|nr:hypothetical protein [Achromobacter aloeverae]RXN90368.1 hypothetical protein C7R54_12710 [Achromobacter aloeverae]
MDLYAPTISPLNTSRQLQTAVGVTATPEVADAGANDVTVMVWGCWEPPTTNPAYAPFQAVNISQNQICNGEVWCWYSVTDRIGNTAYSDIAKPQVISTQQYPDKPVVTPANANAPSAGMNVVTSLKNNFNSNLTLQATDAVTVTWWIYDNNGDGWTNPRQYTSPKLLASPIISGTFSFGGLTPAPAANQYALVWFDVERTQHSSSAAPDRYQRFTSDVTHIAGSDWYTPVPDKLPAPVFDGGNVIDLDRITGDIPATIPKTSRITPTSQVKLFGLGFDQNGNMVPGSDWAQPAPGISTPYPYKVPRAKVALVPNGGDYVISYTVDGTASPTSHAQVKQATPPPPSVPMGSVWGWGDSEYGTLGA